MQSNLGLSGSRWHAPCWWAVQFRNLIYCFTFWKLTQMFFFLSYKRHLQTFPCSTKRECPSFWSFLFSILLFISFLISSIFSSLLFLSSSILISSHFFCFLIVSCHLFSCLITSFITLISSFLVLFHLITGLFCLLLFFHNFISFIYLHCLIISHPFTSLPIFFSHLIPSLRIILSCFVSSLLVSCLLSLS